MTQILRNTPRTLELKVYQNGDLTDLDTDPTLALTDANGVAVTTGSVSRSSTGIYQSVVDGQSNLKTLRAEWSGNLAAKPVVFVQQYEVVGSLLFTESEARSKTITGQQTPLSDENLYPDAAIARMRTLISNQFEHRTGRSWIRRYCRVEISGSGTHVINPRDGESRDSDGNESGGAGRYRNIRKIIGATIDGTTIDANDIKVSGRKIIYTEGLWSRPSTVDPFNVVLEYEYGDDPVDLEANENGLRMVVANIQPSDVSGYAQSFSRPDGTTTFPQGGWAWPSKVWEWLKKNPPVLLA